MTPAQILRQNFGRRPIDDDGEFVSDLEAARARHLRGQEQPTREAPVVVAALEMEWPDEPEVPAVPVLDVEFAE